MTGRQETPEAARPQGPAGGWLRIAAALALAGISAFAAFSLAFTVRHLLAPWLLLIVGILAGVGFLCLFSAFAGFLRFGLQSRQREFLDGLADAIGDPIIVTDGRGRVIYANGPYVALASEAGAARLVGMDVLFAGYPEFAGPLYKLAQAGIEGRPEECEIRIAPGSSAPGGKAAETVWLRIKVAPFALAGGKPYTVWTLADISDDRARQEQAFARLQFIITYLDHAPAGFYSTLPDGKVDYINATLAAWLGRDVTQGEELTLAKLAGEKAAAVLRGVTAGVPGVVGVLVAGQLAESRGRRVVIIVGLLVATAFQVTFFVGAGALLWIMPTVSIVAASCAGIGLGTTNNELFPTEARGTSSGFLLVAGVAGAAIGLLLASRLKDVAGGLGPAIALLGVAVRSSARRDPAASP